MPGQALTMQQTGDSGSPALSPRPTASAETVSSSESGNNGDTLEVIVTFHGEGAPDDQHIDLLESLGITSGFTFRIFPAAGIIATPDQAETLSNHEEVLAVHPNEPVQLENNEATEAVGARTVNDDMSVTGDGIGILINDSGIDGLHPDVAWLQNLVQNVQGAVNLQDISEFMPPVYAEHQPNTDLTSGHGTHVAGTAAGTGAASDGTFRGAAPGADLIGFGSGAGMFILDVLTAFEYAILNREQYNIRVINNSWGSNNDTGTDFDPTHPISRASYEAFKNDIVVVFSAGNSGPDAGTITGNYKKAPWVISVAASNNSGLLANFSSRGEPDRSGSFEWDGEVWTWHDRPTITAPGIRLVSARATTEGLDLDFDPDSNYTTMSGTSMSAPLTSGTVALMLEANPQLDPLQIREMLEHSAEPIPGREPWEAGAGFLNAAEAVQQAQKGLANTPPPLHPTEIVLKQNYPNPFNPATTITYSIPEQTHVRLEIFDPLGRHVGTLVDEVQNAGMHQARFDAGSRSSGLYIYRLTANGQTFTRNMSLTR